MTLPSTPQKLNIFKAVFGRIWAVWGLISFVTTFLLIFIPSMISHLIPGKAGQDYFIAVSRIWMRIWLTLIGCPVRIYGRHYFQSGCSYVVVFNHNALLDVPLSAPFVPGANKTIAKSSFTKVPLFGFFYARGSVLVDRKDERSRRRSFDQMMRVLKQGMHMCLYPEGTRNRTTEPLKPFYDGAFKLSVDSGKSIIPCVLTGTGKAMPINIPFFLWPTRLEMHFMPPVDPSGKAVTQLKEEVFQQMKKMYMQKNSATE